VDICTFIGTIGLFLTLFLLFARFLPMIAMAEVKGVASQEKHVFAGQPEGSALHQ
jgi:molybdopterin-containing oxidoreductase family membrane subunit